MKNVLVFCATLLTAAVCFGGAVAVNPTKAADTLGGVPASGFHKTSEPITNSIVVPIGGTMNLSSNAVTLFPGATNDWVVVGGTNVQRTVIGTNTYRLFHPLP